MCKGHGEPIRRGTAHQPLRDDMRMDNPVFERRGDTDERLPLFGDEK